MVVAEKRRPAGESKMRWIKRGARHRDSARQSCADEAQAAVLAELNEGVRSFHAFNPNREGGRWQAVEKL
ncbi:hypothetical protein BLL42_19000 [Pseudomonas frederiksbergensis]|uniref:Uncharacterized protein n=1 Tax=Pseudomonas frederiksbergensis TaxID=104087 RepID=A0A1J0EP57_9PSED|nr:hypothetical protein BLL42_19000 [Pseudomonas frederiksbergensis]